MGKIYETAEDLQQQPFFHIPFWQAPSKDVFSQRAIRLEELAAEDTTDWSHYLLLVAKISKAQQQLLDALPEPETQWARPADAEEDYVPLSHVLSASQAAPLKTLLNDLSEALQTALSSTAKVILQELLAKDEADLLGLFQRVLRQEVAAAEADYSVWLSAVLQVWFTKQAQSVPSKLLPSRDERLMCPCCGGDAVGSIVIGSGELENLRYLQCNVCNSRWNALRAKCTFCGNTRHMNLQSVEGVTEGVLSGAHGECCEECHGYRKLYRQSKQQYAEPIADDLASLGLDMSLAEAGYQRGGANPFLLVNQQ